MTETNQPEELQQNWNAFVEEMNEAFFDAVEQNMEAQAAFVESWTEAMESSAEDMTTIQDGFEGYARAYETWMEASEKMFDRASKAIEGEDVDATEFRDVWLQSANEAFKEVMSTTAFAAATGKVVEEMLDYKSQADEMTAETVHEMGFATAKDMEEVGERLVELERRQQSIEEKLDELIEKVG